MSQISAQGRFQEMRNLQQPHRLFHKVGQGILLLESVRLIVRQIIPGTLNQILVLQIHGRLLVELFLQILPQLRPLRTHKPGMALPGLLHIAGLTEQQAADLPVILIIPGTALFVQQIHVLYLAEVLCLHMPQHPLQLRTHKSGTALPGRQY